VFSVALGTFTLVTNEFLPVALLTDIRTSLGVSQGTAATMVTVPAVVAAIASPALPWHPDGWTGGWCCS
jgi:predicted MFS family arabinose efflux permease